MRACGREIYQPPRQPPSNPIACLAGQGKGIESRVAVNPPRGGRIAPMGSCRHESSDWWPAQRRASSARLISIRSASEGPVSGRRSLTRAVFDFAQVLGSVASSKFARTKSAGLGSSRMAKSSEAESRNWPV